VGDGAHESGCFPILVPSPHSGNSNQPCVLNKISSPSSPLACGLSSPIFIGNNSRIELSYSINFFVGDQLIIQREMEGSEEGEVRLKEMKDIVLLLAKQMVEPQAAMSQTEEMASLSSSEATLATLQGPRGTSNGQALYAAYKKLEQCCQ